MRTKYAILSRFAINNKDSGNVSLIEVIEVFSSSSFPAMLNEFAFVAVFDREDSEGGDYPCVFTIEHVAGGGDVEMLAEFNGEMKVTENDRCRVTAIVDSMSIPRPGAMRCRIDVKRPGVDEVVATAVQDVAVQVRATTVTLNTSTED